MNEQHERVTTLGKHQLITDGDSVFVIARGTVTLDDMRGFLNHFARIKQEYGCLFTFYDGRQSAGIDAEARKLATDQPKSNKEADLQVIFGVSFTVRVVLNMIVRAQKVLQNRRVQLHVFATENEARTFFDTERNRIRKELGVKPSL